LAFRVSSTASLRAAKSRLKSASAPRLSTQSRIERLRSIAAEINAYLLVAAIGLGTLDFAVMVALNLPGPSELSSSRGGQDDVISIADPNIATTLGRSFP